MSLSISHNPRCSKSRPTLQLLQARDAQPEIIEYLKTPPDAATLDELLKMLDMEPRELMRKKEAEYKQFGADNPSLTRDQLIALMVEHPKLIERPIVVKGAKARLGRPPEKVLEII